LFSIVLFLLFYTENNTSGHLCSYMKTLPFLGEVFLKEEVGTS
jgi:hypothetical protein